MSLRSVSLGRRRLVVINDFSEARGGATGLALRSAAEFAQRGVEVVLLTGDQGHNKGLEEQGVHIVGFGGLPLLKKSRAQAVVSGLFNWQAASRLKAWIRTHGRSDDVYHLHGWSKILSPAVFSALRSVQTRLVLHAHDFFLTCPNGAFWDYQRNSTCHLTPLSQACLATHCDRRSYGQKLWRFTRSGLRELAMPLGTQGAEILLIHPKMRSFFLRAGVAEKRLTVLRNPTEPFCTERVVAEKNKHVVFVGRLDPEKGVLELARAARAAGVALRVVGDGPLAGELQRVYPGVELLGWRSRAELPEIAQEARALVMPSLYPEPFGLVAAEALGSGLPVLIAETAFLADEIMEHGAGRKIDPRNTMQFSRVLQEVAGDDQAVAAMSAQALKLGPELCLDFESWCDQLEAAYQRCGGSFHTTVPQMAR